MATGTATNIVPIDGAAFAVRSREPVSTAIVPDIGKKRAESSTSFEGSFTFLARAGATSDRASVKMPRLSQADLYPARHAFSPQHLAAIRLLRIAVGRTQRAMAALSEGDDIGADSETQRVQVLLPELFCCRALGDGFGMTIGALMSAFECLQGRAMSGSQLRTVNGIFSLLLDKPFLSTGEADDQLERLESAQLKTYPAELEEFLSSGDESVR
jgi:hypothetical protein